MSFKVLMQLQTKEFQRGLKGIQRQLNGFKNFMKSAFALGSVTMFGKELVQVGKDFENAMARVQAVSNATTDEFKKMQAEAQRLGSTTRYTATEAAEALENLTRNGMSAANATKALSGVLQLAQANAIGLADAANIVTNTLNMFNLGVEQTGRVNDVLSSTASHAATDITSLYEAMVNAAPAANVLGLSLEETASAIGALAQRGVKGAEAGTKMRIALQKMADPKVVAKMKDYGIAVDENSIKTEGLRKTIEKIAKANLSLGQLGKIFDAKSAMAIQQLVASLDDLDYMLGVTGNAAGETARMFEQGVGSVQGELDTLKSKYEGLLISISQKTSGAVKGVVRILQDLVDNFKTLGGSIANIASVAVPLLTKRVITLASSLKTMFTQAAAGAATLKAAMGGIVTIIATIATWVGTSLYTAWRKSTEAMRDADSKMASARIEAIETQKAVNKLKNEIGDGSNRNSVNGALAKAIQLFPEFESALRSAAAEAARTGNWEKLKETLQDIADLQNMIASREAWQARKDAQESTLGNRMYTEGGWWQNAFDAPRGRSYPEMRLRENIDKQGYLDKDRERFYKDLARKIIASRDREGNIISGKVDEIKEYLYDWGAPLTDSEIEKLINKYNPVKGSGRNAELSSGARISGEEVAKRDTLIDNNKAEILIKNFERQEENQKALLKEGKTTAADVKEVMTQAADELRAAAQTSEYITDEMRTKLLDNANKYPAEVRRSPSGGGGGGDDGSSASKIKTDTDKIKDAIKDYNEEVTKLNNRLEAGTIATEDYEKELDNLEDKTWEAITSISKFAEILDKIGKGEFGKDLANKYATNRANENAEELITPYQNLAKYLTLPKMGERSRGYDKKSSNEQLEEDVRISLDYADAIEKFAKDLEAAIENGDYDIVNGDAIEILENLKTKAQEAATAADTLQTKLDLSEAITKLDEQIKSLGQTAIDSFEGFAGSMDRIMSGLWAIAEIFDEDLRDSPMFQAFEAFSSVLNSSIQIMQGVAQAIQIVKAIQSKAAMQKVKDAAAEVAANKMATQSEMEKAGAEATAAAAGGANAVASVPLVGPALAVAAAGAIAAALLAAFSKFEKGGIVPGHSYSGDKVPAMVSSGEMVLNRSQQATLFNAIKSGNLGGGAVDFRIRGCDLVGVINNEQSRRRG